MRDLAAWWHDGSRFTADMNLSPLVTPTELLTIATIRDVTDRKESERKIRAQLDNLTLLDQITRAIAERQDLRSILQVVVRSCCICLHERASGMLFVDCVGIKSATLARELALEERASFQIDENGLGRCMRGTLIYEPDINDSPFPFPQRLAGAGLRSVVMAPLRSEDSTFGMLITTRCAPRAFASADCEFLRQLSQQVGLAVHQTQLHTALQAADEDLRRTQQVMLQEERLRALGQMVSGIAHDINNAMSPVSLYVESLLDTETHLTESGPATTAHDPASDQRRHANGHAPARLFTGTGTEHLSSR